MRGKFVRYLSVGFMPLVALLMPLKAFAEDARSSMQLTVSVIDSSANTSYPAIWDHAMTILAIAGVGLMVLSTLGPVISSARKRAHGNRTTISLPWIGDERPPISYPVWLGAPGIVEISS